jgi:hypothetical protein
MNEGSAFISPEDPRELSFETPHVGQEETARAGAFIRMLCGTGENHFGAVRGLDTAKALEYVC